MKILVAYITVTGGKITEDLAARFVCSYQKFGPGIEHETVIVCNGGPASLEVGSMFLPMSPSFYPRKNDPGWDISAYIDVAGGFDCDMLVCLGESVHFHRAGWLLRMAEAWAKHGPGMYGFWSSNLVRPHLNTTGFVVDPKLLRGYPNAIGSRAERYAFEHGPAPFWIRVAGLGRAVRLVTWHGDYGPGEWRRPPNILWRGDQSNCLAWCSHTDRYFETPQNKRQIWSAGADRVKA